MSPRHDPPARNEPLTPEERVWAERLARIGPHGGPPPALDTKILAAAQAAVAQRRPRRSQRRWPTLVGAAASLVIVVGLAWQLQPLLRSRPSLGEGPVAAAPVPSAEGSLSADVLAAADPVARTGMSHPPPPPEPTVAKAPRRPAPPPPVVANAPVPAPAAPRSPDFVDDAIPPYADMAAARQAAAQAAATDTAARASTDERRERAMSVAPQPFPATRSDAEAAAAMPPPPPPPAAGPPAPAGRVDSPRQATARKATAPQPEAARTSPTTTAAAEQDNSTLDRIEVTGSRIKAADVPVRDDARLEPAAWLQRIRERRDADDLDGARESLALFRKSHPRVRLPADLAELDR